VFTQQGPKNNGQCLLNIRPDGGLVDSSPYVRALSNPGGAACVTGQGSTGGQAINFTGTQYFQAPASADWSWGDGDWTIEAEYYHRANAAGGALVALSYGSGANNWSLYAGDRYLSFTSYASGATGLQNVAASASPFAATTWLHLAAVMRSGVLTLFHHGVPVASGSITNGVGRSDAAIQFGSDGVNNKINGMIANPRIHRRAVYTRQFTPPTRQF